MKKNGFTLLEIVLVVAIVGLLLAITVPGFMSFRQNQALQNSTNAVVGVLQDARTKTLAAVSNTSYGVYVSSTGVTLFTGTTYVSGVATNDSVTFETPVTATYSLQGGGSSILFDRLKGSTSQYGTITLSTPNGQTRTVTISALGTVSRN